MYRWTVNWKFVPESLFLSKPFAALLLFAHISVLLYVGYSKWAKGSGGFSNILNRFLSGSNQSRQVSPRFVAWMVFTGNFIGIVFARSLHYQFYCWFYFSLPFLLWHTNFPIILRLALLALIEVSWNIYPAGSSSSIVMLLSHLGLLVGVLKGCTPGAYLKKRTE